MKSALKRLITGLSFRQEYLCLANELAHPLVASLVSRGKSDPLDVTAAHRFVGYKPLVIAIVFEESHDFSHNEVCVCFTSRTFEANKVWKEFYIDDRGIANLLLTKIETRKFGNSIIVFYEGRYGQHHFIPWHYQMLNSLLLKFKKKPIGNVSLDGNLYDQVRIAYAIPRKIALITVVDNNLMNMFPTDLHGEINGGYYLSSLRIGGEACKQVERLRKLVVSDIEHMCYQSAYDLGKNHMREMRTHSEFDLSGNISELFKIQLPKSAGSYKELEVMETFDLGIHRIFIYKVVNEKNLESILPLFHIHNYYAQWRKNNKLTSDYLLRKSNA